MLCYKRSQTLGFYPTAALPRRKDVMTQPRRKKKRKIWPWLLLVAALAAAALFFFNPARGVQRGLKDVAAQKRDISTWYTFSGNLVPVTDETQSAKRQMTVKEVYVQEDQKVQQGDALLRAADGSRLYASQAGTVEKLFVEVDDMLQPGSQVARIVDYDSLEVSVDVDEYDIDALTLSKEGEVFINALDKTVKGTVSSIAQSATTQGGVSFYAVKFQIAAQRGIRAGMSVEVRVLKEQALSAITLPLSAISYDNENSPYVLIKQEQDMAQRYIVTGLSDGVYVQVVSGVSDQETVSYLDGDMSRFFAFGRPPRAHQ